MMGYLSSCKADSSVLTSDSHYSSTPTSSKSKKEKPLEDRIQEFNYSDLVVATNGFSEQKLLGKGSHGCVYKGVLQSGRLVAVKKPSRSSVVRNLTQNSSSSDTTCEVDNEIYILSKIKSPGLVNLVGFTTDSIDRLLVVEFMSNGTLYDVLHSSSRPPSWARRIRLSLQTAKTIDILHSSSPPVIHRDIKSANVLIDRNFNARLGDFGLALQCHVDNFRLRSTPPAGTIGYLDPGYVTPDNLSTKTDVFSFGILLLEIISGRKAIDIGHSPPSILDWAVPLIRKRNYLSIFDPRIPPPKDPSVIKHLAVLAAKCVRSCRERRPSMKDVAECLSELIKIIPGHSWNNFSVNNPCMMVEAVAHPVETGSTRFNTKPRHPDGGMWDFDRNVSQSMRNSKRVHSNLGLEGRNNLLDLIAEIDGKSNFCGEGNGVETASPAGSRVSNFRGGSGRFIGRGRTESLPRIYDKGDVFQLNRNQSVGGRVGLFSKPDRHGRLTGTVFCAQAADHV
ncbi:Serine/threonine-protein kinase-like protein [Thalictrum thalictroides]|uniref:Serine/threonine-protein kinase-like protein n=1 Tax=Thalictrum thalictroides TaxID=46969 RepID=A0A7J6VKJ6_THATH|nr:Serine/threonine-protein kinase-like protein [Thalictrum thalictroides]